MKIRTILNKDDVIKHIGIQRFFLIGLLFLFNYLNIFAGDRNLLLNLSGHWKFSIGDNPEWQKFDYKDSTWESIKVPSAREDRVLWL